MRRLARYALRRLSRPAPAIGALLALWAAGSSVPAVKALCLEPRGDVDGSGFADVLDVQCNLLVAFWELTGGGAPLPACVQGDWQRADPNCDLTVDVADVQITILHALELPLPAVVDTNGNGCHDNCEPDCGDGVCATSETCASCPTDCGVCSGECCVPNATPGCEVQLIQSCVCQASSFCCTVAWDATCVSLAGSQGCGPCSEDCCGVHAGAGCGDATCEGCVCASDPYCCDAGWDGLCVTRAALGCSEACGCTISDCCSEPGSLPGCANGLCEACVCAIDPYCCVAPFAPKCVALARAECQPACGCQPTGPPCCLASEDAGCGADPACEACVCGADPFCCDTQWDELCTVEAALSCEAECGCVLSDCCAEGGNVPGCANANCNDCVCTFDPYCCAVAFDGVCVLGAQQECAADCGCGLLPAGCCGPQGGVGCGDAVCEACVCAGDSFCCDAQWDELCGAAAATSCAAQCGCALSDCCEEASAVPGCASPTCEACVCSEDAYCCGVSWDTFCLDLASGGCASECPCGGAAGSDCCGSKTGPGCSDAVCEACVCGADPFCCAGAWDEACALAAGLACDAACAACELSDCCSGPGTMAGCADLGCEACVCGVDPYCCAVAFDLGCVVEARSECALACDCPRPLDCCLESDAAGCGDAVCEACVCAEDDFCCESVWDGLCVSTAQGACLTSCGCSPGGPCCQPLAQAGCPQPSCESCTCGVDPFCCDGLWDDFCVQFAALACEPECGCALSDCCSAGTIPGCVSGTCEDCVCAGAPTCCTLLWDDGCAAAAAGDCGASCGCP